MRPLILGIREEDPAFPSGSDRSSLVVRDRPTGEWLGEIGLSSAGRIPLSRGALALFRTVSCRNATAPTLVRWRRYAAAWIHAKRAASRGDGLCMSAADLRCLNVYYMAPRPVYLIGVRHGSRSNLFPMDLVGRVASGDFLLALRGTSPAIDLMESSRTIAMSAAPADHLAQVYALGAHHRKASVDTSALSFRIERSLVHGLPILTEGFTRELTVRDTHRIGSHVLFVCQVDAENGSTPRQLAHVSQMYAEWLARRDRLLEEVRVADRR